jgi:hypothetical protein
VIVIAIHRLTFCLRLVLVATLAGYTLPAAGFAMHGDVAAAYLRMSEPTVRHATHSHEDAGAVHDHGGHAADHHGKLVKQGCCSNVCLNLAVIGDVPQCCAARTAGIRTYADDRRVFAEPIRPDRPPAARA